MNCEKSFVMLNEVKHLGCATWMYTRSFTFVQDDNTSRIFRRPILFYYNIRIPPNCLVGAYAIRPYMGCLRIFKKINSALLRLCVP